MLDTYKPLIYKILKKVPSHLRDDCYQAACLGLVKALEKKEDVTFFRSYAYKCMQSEVIQELAALNDPLPLDHNTFFLLCKYKKEKNAGRDVAELNVSSDRLKNLIKLNDSKRVSYREAFQDDEDWNI